LQRGFRNHCDVYDIQRGGLRRRQLKSTDATAGGDTRWNFYYYGYSCRDVAIR
jgi:hypothetical protein